MYEPWYHGVHQPAPEADVIELVASEFGYDVEFIGVEDAGRNGRRRS